MRDALLLGGGILILAAAQAVGAHTARGTYERPTMLARAGLGTVSISRAELRADALLANVYEALDVPRPVRRGAARAGTARPSPGRAHELVRRA